MNKYENVKYPIRSNQKSMNDSADLPEVKSSDDWMLDKDERKKNDK